MRGLELDFRNDMFYIKFLFKPGTGETPYCIHTWRSPVSAYEMKNNCCLSERLFKTNKNGIFLFEISFSQLEILTFLYFAN